MLASPLATVTKLGVEHIYIRETPAKIAAVDATTASCQLAYIQ